MRSLALPELPMSLSSSGPEHVKDPPCTQSFQGKSSTWPAAQATMKRAGNATGLALTCRWSFRVQVKSPNDERKLKFRNGAKRRHCGQTSHSGNTKDGSPPNLPASG